MTTCAATCGSSPLVGAAEPRCACAIDDARRPRCRPRRRTSAGPYRSHGTRGCMDHNSRERRRRETAVRLSQSHADIVTSLLARVPRMAATSMRGGVLALLMNLRKRPRTDGELESVWRIVASLGKLKGAAMKLGQHLSYFDPTLPDDVCAMLAALQTHSPPMSVSRVTKILHKDLGAAASPLITTVRAGADRLRLRSVRSIARRCPMARASRSRSSTRASRARSKPTSVRPRSRGGLPPGSIPRSMSTPTCAKRRCACSTSAITGPRRAITPRSRTTTPITTSSRPRDPRGVLRCACPHDDVRRG